MFSTKDPEGNIRFARSYKEAQSSAALTLPSLGHSNDTSPTSYIPDPRAVSKAEARYFYAGLHSKPTLLYRTGKERWSPPKGPECQCRLKELREVFTHKIVNVWNNDRGWKVVQVMDAHTVR